MKLWVDAKREPEVDWVWAKLATTAITMLRGGCVEQVSFAPDQSKMVAEVKAWMLANGVNPPHGAHRRGDGVRFARGMLQCRAVD